MRRCVIRVGTQWLAILASADDVCLFARSKAQIQTMLTQLSSFLRSNGLALQAAKTHG